MKGCPKCQVARHRHFLRQNPIPVPYNVGSGDSKYFQCPVFLTESVFGSSNQLNSQRQKHQVFALRKPGSIMMTAVVGKPGGNNGNY